jgi:hypothetical protein
MAEGRSIHPRDPRDFSVELAWVTELLLDAVPFLGGTYDPACGAGIMWLLKARGPRALGKRPPRSGGRAVQGPRLSDLA